MGLTFESLATGYGTLATSLTSAVKRDEIRRVQMQPTPEAATWPR
jgi:hypothetical protein